MSIQKHIDIGTLVDVLRRIAAHESHDVLSCSVIAREYRVAIGSQVEPKESQKAIIESFALLAPSSIGIEPNTGRVFIYTDPEQLRHEIVRQVQAVPGRYVVGALTSAVAK